MENLKKSTISDVHTSEANCCLLGWSWPTITQLKTERTYAGNFKEGEEGKFYSSGFFGGS